MPFLPLVRLTLAIPLQHQSISQTLLPCSAVCLMGQHSQGEKRQLQIQQHWSWYSRGTSELQKSPKQWLHGLTQKLFPGLACSLSWRALGDGSCVSVTYCLIGTLTVPTCPHLSSLTLWHSVELSGGCWK